MKYVCDFSSDGIVLADMDSGEKTSYTVESFYDEFYVLDYTQEGVDTSEPIFGAYFENDSKPIFEPLSHEQALKCVELMKKIKGDMARQYLLRGIRFVAKPFTDERVILYRAGNHKGYHIPKYVTTLCDSCFFGTKLPDKLVIPDNVKVLSSACFLRVNIPEIQCPASLQAMETAIFFESNIGSFVFPEEVEFLSTDVFSTLTSNTVFYVPEKLYVRNRSIFDSLDSYYNPVNII